MCVAGLLIVTSLALALVIVYIALDHTIRPDALSVDQMNRIRSAAIGVRDTVFGSAFVSTFILFWLFKRGWMPPVNGSDRGA